MKRKYKVERFRYYDPSIWKVTGPNSRRNLENIAYSLNQDDYLNPDDYDWDLMLMEVISQAIEDLCKAPKDSQIYKTASRFIYTSDLDQWCIAFGQDIDTMRVRAMTDRVLNNEDARLTFLRNLHSKTQNRYRQGIRHTENK